MTITLPRALVQQVLEALDHEIDTRRCKSSTLRAMISLRAALAQQDEPAREWVSMDEYKRLQGLVTSQGIRLMEYESKQPQQAEPVQEPEGMVEFLADLQRSRTKYPKNRRMFDGLMGEIDELRRAYAGDGDIRAEAFDVAVCAFRIATEGDAGGSARLEQAEPAQEPVAWAFRHSDGTYHDPSVTEHSAGMVPLYPPPPQRKPLTLEEILKATGHCGVSKYTAVNITRAVERAHEIGVDDGQT